MTQSTGKSQQERRRLGGWLPGNEAHLAQYRTELAARARTRAKAPGTDLPRNASVAQLAALVKGDPVLRTELTRAIHQAQHEDYVLGYSNIDELMTIIDCLMTYAPPFSESSLIHCPLNAVLDWPMCMPSGYALFRDPAFNV